MEYTKWTTVSLERNVSFEHIIESNSVVHLKCMNVRNNNCICCIFISKYPTNVQKKTNMYHNYYPFIYNYTKDNMTA